MYIKLYIFQTIVHKIVNFLEHVVHEIVDKIVHGVVDMRYEIAHVIVYGIVYKFKKRDPSFALPGSHWLMIPLCGFAWLETETTQ